jgi:hypothetical protein
MNTISYKDFEEFCHNSEILQWKDGLPSTVRHDANLISKVWDRRKRPSSDWIYPYYRRFCRNARKLIFHGVPAPDVKHTSRVSGTNIHIVTYEELPGMSLKNVLTKHKEMLDVGGFAGFLAHLHNRGIYFRALHLGNVLRLDSGSFGLIDVADVHFLIFSLSLNMRARNLSRLLYYKKHRMILEEHFEAIVREYCARIKMDAGSYGRFSEKIQAHLAARQSNRKHRRGLTALSNREHDTKE